MSIQPPFSVRRDYLSRLEQQYALPTKQFLKESYEEHPVATTVMVIFVASSFIPVVISVALAIFTICVGVSASLVTLLGLALCLAVLLLTALFSSVVITLLAVGVLHLCNPSGAFKAHPTSTSDTPADTSDPTSTLPKNRFSWIKAIFSATNSTTSTLSPLLSRGSRKIRLLALVLICDAISRIRLPQFVRYNLIYRTLFGTSLFGPRRSSHFLQRALSSPFRILRNVVWAVLALGVNIAAVPFHLFGWKAALAMYIILFILSPLRVIAARYIVRTTSYLVTGLAPAMIFILRSEPANKLRELSLEAFTASQKTLTHSTSI
ncbi:hypothetical protein B0H14DRAFT_3876334 [Mycena olivaceomarginata]|nr:hypothetical protein B0H14DRAFT_3876334 [Mycena olivaceomarginata]